MDIRGLTEVVARLRARAAWLASAILHVAVIVLAVTVTGRVRTRMTFINLTPPAIPARSALPPYGGSARGRGPSGGLGDPVPVAPVGRGAPTPLGKADSRLAANSAAVGPHIITGPRLVDPRVWVTPRPALPAEVAEVLYAQRDSVARESIVVRRLRAMVDSLNRIIDVEQREHRLPSWTAEVAGAKFGMDSAHIYVAGVKIPTAALALLGNLLPQGNFDESMRGRQLADMRADMVQAARRAQTLYEFRQYVRELRERKQGERDAARRQRGDTTTTIRDTVRAVP